MSTFILELATILKTTPKNAPIRAAKLQLFPACNRCGGSGQYSFNMMDGSRCYGCGGAGCRIPKGKVEESKAIAAAIEAAESGKLAEYIASIEAKNRCKGATDKVMAAWVATGISKAYRWQDATVPGRDKDIAAINELMHDAYQKVSKASGNATFAKKGHEVAAYLELDKILVEAMAEIEEANKAFQAYLEANPAP